MNGMRFGTDLLMNIINLDIVQISIQLFLTLWVIDKLLPYIQPKVAQMLNIQDSEKQPIVHFISAQISMLLLALPVLTITDISNYPFLNSFGGGMQVGHLSLMLYFIFSLTLWEFDVNFTVIRRISKKKTYINAGIIFIISYILQIVIYSYNSFRLLDSVVHSMHFSIVTLVAISCIARNNRSMETGI